MAFDMRPFNNLFFDINQGDFIIDLGRQVFNQSPFSASSITTCL
ncbi:heat-shock protein, partial [Staphylococcus cohnii]